MMKKRIISLFVLMIFITVTSIYLNKVFSSTNYYVNTFEDFKALEKQSNIDIIAYGSSHTLTGFNPLIIDEECETISYNLGSIALRLPITKLMVQESLRYANPKLIIIEMHSASLVNPIEEEQKWFQLRVLDHVSNFSVDKFITVNKIYNKDEFLSVYFPFIREHSKWNDYDYTNLSPKRDSIDYVFYSKGLLSETTTITEKDKNSYKDFLLKSGVNDSSDKIINASIKRNIEEIINIGKKNDIQILIVSFPSLKGVSENNYIFEELTNICDSLNVNYINFNEYFSEIGLTINDFRDADHLNLYGGIKTSKFLAKYINENYVLPNRQTEKVWEESQQELKGFNQLYFSKEDGVFKRRLADTLIDKIVMKHIAITRKDQNYEYVIEFNEADSLHKISKDYIMEIQVYPYENDRDALTEESRDKNFERNATRINLNEHNELSFNFTSEIKNIKMIKMFLYKPGVLGIQGKAKELKRLIFD